MAARLRIFLLILAFSLVHLRAAQPWDDPFASDTAAILLEASQVPGEDDDPVIVLLDDWRFAVDKQGRTSTTYRRVYRIRQKEAVEGWSAIEWEYQPWHEETPVIRARVLTPGGGVHWLDAGTIADSPSREYDASIFSDRRVARAPLPAVSEGAVVEFEISVQEKAPQLQSGSVRRIPVQDRHPIRRFHLLIEAHKSIPLQTAFGLIPASAIERESTGKGLRVEVELGPLEARENYFFDLPPDVPQQPYFAFSTGQSWQALATEYEAIVEDALASADLTNFLSGIDLTGEPRAVAARLTAKLHDEIRYTGVEFAEAEIIPGPPSQTLQRKYGDCKDKSALLVAMLRAAGIEAYTALLLAGSETDVDRDLPGIGMFNHVIVYAATEPPLWIDATAEATPVGSLPVADQDRLALIAHSSTTGLVSTPAANAEDNRQVTVFEIRLKEQGKGEITESVEAEGTFTDRYRNLLGLKSEDLRKKYERLIEVGYPGSTLVDYSPPGESSEGPLRFQVVVANVSTVRTGFDDATAGIVPNLVFRALPFALSSRMRPRSRVDREDQPKRKHDLVFRQPHQIELTYRIHPPAMFKTTDLPEPLALVAGPATFSRSFTVQSDGTVEGSYRFHSGARRWTPEDIEQFGDAFKDISLPLVEIIRFEPVTQDLIATNEIQKALALVQDSLAANDGAVARSRYAKLLLSAGLGGPALVEAQKAVDADPGSLFGWQTLAWVHQHDLLGRRFGAGWDREEAAKSLRRALEISPDDERAKASLVETIAHNEHGTLFGAGVDLEEVVRLSKELKAPLLMKDNLFVEALIRAGRLDEAKAELKKSDKRLRSRLALAITAIADGPQAALRSAQSLSNDSGFLSALAFDLVRLRSYEPAGAMMSAAARVGGEPRLQALANILSRTKRYEEILAPETDPLRPVQDFLLAVYGVGRSAARTHDIAEKLELRRYRDEAARSLGPALSGGFSVENRADILLGGFETKRTGEEGKGYRFSIYYLPPVFVAEDGERFRRIGSGENFAPAGEHILSLLDSGEIEAAKWWLKEVFPAVKPSADEPGLPAVGSLASWVTDATEDPNVIRPAAASLVGRYASSDRAISILVTARGTAENDLDRAQLNLALCEAYASAGHWTELLATAKSLIASRHFKAEGLHYAQKAAVASQLWAELETLAAARLEEQPEDRTGMRAMAIAKSHQGDFEERDAWLEKLGKGPFAGVHIARLEAWLAILSGKPDRSHVETLSSKDRRTGVQEVDTLYTLAELHAVLGEPDDAMHSLRLAVANSSVSELDAKAWVIYGKICEGYGFPAEAAKAYERAKATPPRDDMDWWALASL